MLGQNRRESPRFRFALGQQGEIGVAGVASIQCPFGGAVAQQPKVQGGHG